MSNTIECSDEVLQYLREVVIDRVEDLLGDPHGVLGGDSAPEYYRLLDQTCSAVGLNLDGLIMDRGTEYERTRLWSLL